jgi:hypothetical protein
MDHRSPHPGVAGSAPAASEQSRSLPVPSSDLLIAFFTAAATFAFIPGPGILYEAAQAMAGGRTVGRLGTLGLAHGGTMHVLAAAVRLSVVFHAVPPLYAAVKLIGAAYLVWLGISMIRTKAAGADGAPVVARKSGKRALVQGITLDRRCHAGLELHAGLFRRCLRDGMAGPAQPGPQLPVAPVRTVACLAPSVFVFRHRPGLAGPGRRRTLAERLPFRHQHSGQGGCESAAAWEGACGRLTHGPAARRLTRRRQF